jgi:hypothetical protein
VDVIDWLPATDPTPTPPPSPEQPADPSGVILLERVVPTPPASPSNPPAAHSKPHSSRFALFLLGLVLAVLILLGGATALALRLSPGKVLPVAEASPASSSNLEGRAPLDSTPLPVPELDSVPPPQPPLDPTQGGPRAPSPPVPPPALEPVPPPVKPGANPRPDDFPRERNGLTREQQALVNQAIEKGVAFLKDKQSGKGSWPGGHEIGMTALPALTLLECGVRPDNEQVQIAARLVRNSAGQLQATYELSLAILFLDRLGDKQDRKLIQTFALRLVAGQQKSGGWSYNCPILKPADEQKLLTALQVTRPRSPLDLFVPQKNGKPPSWFVPIRPPQPLKDFMTRPGTAPGLEGRATERPKEPAPQPPGSTIPFRPGDEPAPGKPQQPGQILTKPGPTPDEVRQALEQLPQSLRRTPALRPIKESHVLPQQVDGTDNSNTQFAVLGLWAASRHDVALERALALIVIRFRSSQNRDGSWGYVYQRGGRASGTPAMTCAGLLGLAVGHGLALGSGAQRDESVTFKDRAIESGLAALAEHIGKPLADGQKWKVGPGKRPAVVAARNPVNLYLLWSIERVAVLYNLSRIDGKDWYLWGAEELLERQRDDGAWAQHGYPGSNELVDTCLALLFLKRANLATDLSEKLEFLIQKRPGDPGP